VIRMQPQHPAPVHAWVTRGSAPLRRRWRQDAALTAAGVTKTFSDTISGAKVDRPGLAALMDYVREGDTVVGWKLDQLGRTTLHILETVKALTECGVTLISATDGIDSSTAAGRMVIGCPQAWPSLSASWSRNGHPREVIPIYLRGRSARGGALRSPKAGADQLRDRPKKRFYLLDGVKAREQNHR
jgi:hypothetical protein